MVVHEGEEHLAANVERGCAVGDLFLCSGEAETERADPFVCHVGW
jgi:hypothetical protein